MTKYQVIRTFNHSEYAYVEANSEEEAKEKAIEDDCWEKNPNDVFFGYEYITIKKDKDETD